MTYLFQICAVSEDINLFCELFLKVLNVLWKSLYYICKINPKSALKGYEIQAILFGS